ncbi:MAG TPA: dihydrolipoyl dehydrogenase [Gammaproteobacteria bacterium]|nr:dihydrolipoyl dehydrogenase [Gammaproteobacteria bacterium]
MSRKVDVAIIGSGTSGLNAMGQVRRAGKSFVLINGGEPGTTCARVGCMPSKAFIQVAEDFHRRKVLSRHAIEGGDSLSIDIEAALEHTRDLRDIFVDRVLGGSTDNLGDEFIQDYAEFVAPNRLKVGDEEIEADAIVIATGSTPIVPDAWKALGDRIVTTDDFFELEQLPASMAVIGLGVIGLELGQALCRLGIEVTGIDALETISGLVDPVVSQSAIDVIGAEMPMWLGQQAELSAEGDQLRVKTADHDIVVDKALISIGRRPNLDRLGLEKLGVELDERGLPSYDPQTMQIADLPVYLAGDINGDLPILHEAGDEGKIAGYNAARGTATRFERKAPLAITFCDPNIVTAGACWSELKDREDVVTAEMPMGPVGRALIMAKNKGVIRVYAEKSTGLILGGAMVAVKGESLGHLLAWMVQQKMTVEQALQLPFYHPVIEEALQGALNNLLGKVDAKPEIPPGLKLASAEG